MEVQVQLGSDVHYDILFVCRNGQSGPSKAMEDNMFHPFSFVESSIIDQILKEVQRITEKHEETTGEKLQALEISKVWREKLENRGYINMNGFWIKFQG